MEELRQMKTDLASICKELEEKTEIFARWTLNDCPESEKATKSIPYLRLSDRMKPFGLSIQKKLAELNVQLYEAKKRKTEEDRIKKIEELIRDYKDFQEFFDVKPMKCIQEVFKATMMKVIAEKSIEDLGSHEGIAFF